MLFYESERSDQHNYLYCQRDHNFNFPAHLHHSFEFLCVQSGTLACTLETEQYEVHPGEALLVLPDQIHSYRTIGESQSVLWVFSTDWVPEFISQLGQREFITPVFRMEAAPLMELLWPGGNRCKQLAGLYLICGAALEQCFLQPRPVPDVDAHLSSKIIDYVQKNYTHTLTLEQMARDLGYNYTYLSAYFNHSLHTGFQGFINQYRISHAASPRSLAPRTVMRSAAPLPAPTKCTIVQPSLICCNNVCACVVWHRRPYSFEKTIAPAVISPHLCPRFSSMREARRVSVCAYKPSSFKMRRQSSHMTQARSSRTFSARSPSAAAWAASSSMRQSPKRECVFHIPPASFTSLPMCPTSSAPRKPSARQCSSASPMKLLVKTAVRGSRPMDARMKSAP